MRSEASSFCFDSHQLGKALGCSEPRFVPFVLDNVNLAGDEEVEEEKEEEEEMDERGGGGREANSSTMTLNCCRGSGSPLQHIMEIHRPLLKGSVTNHRSRSRWPVAYIYSNHTDVEDFFFFCLVARFLLVYLGKVFKNLPADLRIC